MNNKTLIFIADNRSWDSNNNKKDRIENDMELMEISTLPDITYSYAINIINAHIL